MPPLPGLVRAQLHAGTLLVRITVHRNQRLPHYLSPSTKGMTVDIKGPTKVKKTVGLIVGTAGCESKLMNLQCALRVGNLHACPSKKPCYTATIRTYDAYANKKIPPGAHLLSATEGFKFHIGSGSTFLPLVLDGVPASVAFIPARNTALTGSQTLGFVFPKCTAAAQTVTLIGVDADGNYIVGPGAPTTSLVSGTPTQIRVAPGTSPNVFTLNEPAAPAYAYGKHTVVMSAAAVPSGKGLGAGVVSHVNVTYSGDICGIMTEFALPDSNPDPIGITSGPDGALWITEPGANKIGRMTIDGKITGFTTPSVGETPADIITGFDGALWFTEYSSSKIARITTAGVITETPVPTGNAHPFGITKGPDRNIWFTENTGSKVARMTSLGVIDEFSTLTSGAGPREIVSGPGGALWFSECNANRIASVTTNGVVTEYAVLPAANSDPYGMAVDANDDVWFAQEGHNSIGVATANGDTVSSFMLPGGSSFPQMLAIGPDGAAWFTESSGSRVGRLTPSGALLEFPTTTGGSYPWAITVGPDGAIWFTEELAGKIGRIR